MYAEGACDFQDADTCNGKPSASGVPNNSYTREDDEDATTVDPNFISILEDGESDEEDNLPDLYAILGVAKDANEAEIRAAYRCKSRLVHPDKHAQGSARSNSTTSAPILADADASFGRVVAAYNVLSDPRKRSIYDQFGHRGLRIQGWEVAVREKSAPELRLEYLLLKKKAKQTEEERLLQTQSELCLGIDMTDLFDRYLQESPEDRFYLPVLSVYDFSIYQSVRVVQTLRNTLSLVGQVTAHNGLGIGALIGIWEHRFGTRTPYVGAFVSKTELSYGRSGRGPGVSVKATKRLHDRLSLFTALELTSFSRGGSSILLPGVSLGTNFQLSSSVHADLQYKWGLGGALQAGVVWISERGGHSCRVQSRLTNSGNASLTLRLDSQVDWPWLNPFALQSLSSSHSKNRHKDDWEADLDEEDDLVMTTGVTQKGRVMTSLTCSTYDFVDVHVGVDCVLSEYSRISAEMGASWLQGLSLRLGFHRGNQSYIFPLKLSEVWNPAACGYGLAVPLLSYGIVRSLVYEPWALAQLKKVQDIRRERLRDELRRLRSEAMATQSLMQHTFTRTVRNERSVNGLVIVRALYGRLSPVNPAVPLQCDIGGPLCIDVTVPMQVFVENHQLRLPPGRWADQQGFYDPCAGLGRASNVSRSGGGGGVLRELYVAYLFNGLPHEVVTEDRRGLAIPMPKHRVEAFSTLP